MASSAIAGDGIPHPGPPSNSTPSTHHHHHPQFYHPQHFGSQFAGGGGNIGSSNYGQPQYTHPSNHNQQQSQHCYDDAAAASSAYSSLLFRSNPNNNSAPSQQQLSINELYQLESPSSSATAGDGGGHGLDRKLASTSSDLCTFPQSDLSYRTAQLAATFPHPSQHHYPSIGGYAAPDWMAATSGRDIYLRVGTTLEIGTTPSIGAGGGTTRWHCPSTLGSGGGYQPNLNFNMMDGITGGLQFGSQQITPAHGGLYGNGGGPSEERAIGKCQNQRQQQQQPLLGTANRRVQIMGTNSDGLEENNIATSSSSSSLARRGAEKERRKSAKTSSSSLGDNGDSDGKSYVCTVCGRQYCRKSTLKAHMKHHVGDRPFNCQICGKHFSQAANLTAHQRVHTGEKPFCCPICHRPFSQSSSLVTHKRTHTGERPYPCPHCDKAFTDSSTLTKHLRTHTGQKPYSCILCLMKFSQSGNLHRHMKTHSAIVQSKHH